MNITELARRLKVPTTELKEKLPELGFDIGMRAIKVPDRMAQEIIQKWTQEVKRQRLEDKVLADKEKTKAKEKALEEGAEVIMLPPSISVRDLADKFGMPVPGLMAELMKNGVMAAISDKVDYEIAAIVAEGIGKAVKQGEDISEEQKKAEELQKAILKSKTSDNESDPSRAPVVVVMGHVDHGKTSLLDAIRETDVTKGESGGITQHIGAYQVEKNNRAITFIDTPGHEAFSHMRSRGAIVADVAVLVVAADDGVQPQTIEAIKMIQDAHLPMIVAINKIDLPGAAPDVVKKGLSELNVIVEDWGGEIPVVEVSAKKRTNIDGILEMVLLLADVNKEKLRTRFDGNAQGVIIESHVDSGTGPVATVLIHAGTLHTGDSFQVGDVFGKIRAMKDYNGNIIKKAIPSTPVQIIGLNAVPVVGNMLESGVDLKKLRRIIGKVKKNKLSSSVMNSNNDKSGEDEDHPSYNILLKADVAGTLEAIEHALADIETHEVKIGIIAKGLGSITEVDIVRAAESNAVIYAFHADITTQARQLAQDKEVRIEKCDVIYDLIKKVKADVELLLKPEQIRHEKGKMSVIKLFGKREGGLVVGGEIIEGEVEDENKFIVYRDDKVMGQGGIVEIRIGPEKVRTVSRGDECGIKISGYSDIQENDILEFYSEETKKRTLE